MKKLVIAVALLFSCPLFAGKVTFKDTSSKHLLELTDFIKKELIQNEQVVKHVGVKSITYTSPAMKKVFGAPLFLYPLHLRRKKKLPEWCSLAMKQE